MTTTFRSDGATRKGRSHGNGSASPKRQQHLFSKNPLAVVGCLGPCCAVCVFLRSYAVSTRCAVTDRPWYSTPSFVQLDNLPLPAHETSSPLARAARASAAGPKAITLTSTLSASPSLTASTGTAIKAVAKGFPLLPVRVCGSRTSLPLTSTLSMCHPQARPPFR